jgi:hypothetical protein
MSPAQSRRTAPIVAGLTTLFAVSAVAGGATVAWHSRGHTGPDAAADPRLFRVDHTVAAPAVDAIADGACPTAVHLSWVPVDTAVSYQVLAGLQPAATIPAGGDVLTYTGTTVPGGHTKTFQVFATLPGRTRTAGSKRIDAITCPNPATLTGPASGSTATLRWTSVSAAARYALYRNGRHIHTGTGRTYTDTHRPAGKATYTITAITEPADETTTTIGIGGGTSARSAPLTLTFG